MTWKEFKNRVDKQLEQQGISEETPIWFIDCGIMLMEDREDSPNVSNDKDCGISITD